MATKEKKPRKSTTKKPPEPHWDELVNFWFSYCRDKKGEEPSFDGSAPRDLKNLIESLRIRCEKSNTEWTLEVALLRFKNFLDFAYQDSYLNKNWLLFNLNRQKDKIYFQIRAAINRQPQNPFE